MPKFRLMSFEGSRSHIQDFQELITRITMIFGARLFKRHRNLRFPRFSRFPQIMFFENDSGLSWVFRSHVVAPKPQFVLGAMDTSQTPETLSMRTLGDQNLQSKLPPRAPRPQVRHFPGFSWIFGAYPAMGLGPAGDPRQGLGDRRQPPLGPCPRRPQ